MFARALQTLQQQLCNSSLEGSVVGDTLVAMLSSGGVNASTVAAIMYRYVDDMAYCKDSELLDSLSTALKHAQPDVVMK